MPAERRKRMPDRVGRPAAVLECANRNLPQGERVQEIIRTNNPVLVSAVEALLAGANIPYLVFDQNMSVLEGSLGILPRRVLVAQGFVLRARSLLEDAGLGHELRPERS